MSRASLRPRVNGPESGNAIIFSLLLVSLITAVSFAHVLTVQKNSRQSRFVNDLGKLRRYAETGVNLAVLRLGDGAAGSGQVGTTLWKESHDFGRDGKPGTYDEGEGDGIPTPGEPNLTLSSIGPPTEGMGLLVSTFDTGWANVKRIVSTVSDQENYATVEVFARAETEEIPGVGAVYVQPGAALDFNGNNFTVYGTDTNPNGTAGPDAAVYGIATLLGSPAGSNSQSLIDQVPLKNVDQIKGKGSIPSIGEEGAVDFDALFKAFELSSNVELTPGTYSNVSWGDDSMSSYQVTNVKGDLHITGEGKGAGVLVVDGMLTMSGKFEFVGLVLVKGDVKLTGGGTGIHIFGSMMIKDTLTAIDPSSDVTMTGTSDVRYSSLALSKVKTLLHPSYTVLYWKKLH